MPDVDECQVFAGLCINGKCINTPGSFFCQCPPGMTVDVSGRTCIGVYRTCASTDSISVSCVLVYFSSSCFMICSPNIKKTKQKTVCPMASRPAYWALLPDPWGWALWDTHQWQAPCGRLLLLSGCRLGPWVWWVSWKGQPRVRPAVPSWPRLLS